MLNYSVVAACIFLISFGILSIYQKKYAVGIFDLSSLLLIIAAIIYYKRTLNYNILTNALMLVFGILFLFLLYSGGVDHSGHLWSYIFPMTVMFMVGRNTGLFLILVFFVVANFILIIAVSNDIYTLSFHLRFIGSYAAVTVLSYYMEYVRETMHDQLR